MEKNFTPGPWEIQRHCTAITGNAGVAVAVPSGPAGVWIEVCKEHFANARLIAAAPEMLDALLLVANSGPLNNGLTDEAALQEVRAAIEKAIGN